MGVAEDFPKFRDNYNISSELVSSISYRYKRITRQLNHDFWGTESETAHSLYVGSYGRDTSAKNVSDIDMIFFLPIVNFTKYNDYQNNGPSALLQAVKTSIRNTYPTSESYGDGQVVVINFNDKIKFEILPVFELTANESLLYPNANVGAPGRPATLALR